MAYVLVLFAVPVLAYGVYRFEAWSRRHAAVQALSRQIEAQIERDRPSEAQIGAVLDSVRRVAAVRGRAVGAAQTQHARTLAALQRARRRTPARRSVRRVAGWRTA